MRASRRELSICTGEGAHARRRAAPPLRRRHPARSPTLARHALSVRTGMLAELCSLAASLISHGSPDDDEVRVARRGGGRSLALLPIQRFSFVTVWMSFSIKSATGFRHSTRRLTVIAA